MSDIAAENIALLRSRWPQLAEKILASPPPQNMQWDETGNHPTLVIAGARLWSAYDSDAEAQMQAGMIPQDSEHAAVYGIGGADLIRELLQRPQLKTLYVIVLNTGVLHVLLHCLDHRGWLQDSRVTLVDGATQNKVLLPFAVIPPCLKLSTPDNAKLHDMLVSELILPFERERHRQLEPLRKRQIEQNLTFVEQDGDVQELFDTQPGSTAFVAIAGPTLAKTAGWIKRHRTEGMVIAVDGALKPLLDEGITPDIVVSVDDNRETILRYFQIDLEPCRDARLVYTPLVHNDILKLWPGRRLTSYTFESIYHDVKARFPKGELFVAGSVSHPAVDLAAKIGAQTIYLFGADFGFPGGKIHANTEAPADFYAAASQAGASAMDGHGKRIPTMTSFNGYRLGLEHYIGRNSAIRFINASRDGAHIQGTTYLEDTAA